MLGTNDAYVVRSEPGGTGVYGRAIKRVWKAKSTATTLGARRGK